MTTLIGYGAGSSSQHSKSIKRNKRNADWKGKNETASICRGHYRTYKIPRNLQHAPGTNK